MFRSPSPAGLPALRTMLADIPATPHQVARQLGISTVTLNKYIKSDQAPQPIMLALFWETRWGRSAADTEAANYGAVYYRQAKGLERENAALRRQMEVLERELSLMAISTSGAANGPIWRVG